MERKIHKRFNVFTNEPVIKTSHADGKRREYPWWLMQFPELAGGYPVPVSVQQKRFNPMAQYSVLLGYLQGGLDGSMWMFQPVDVVAERSKKQRGGSLDWPPKRGIPYALPTTAVADNTRVVLPYRISSYDDNINAIKPTTTTPIASQKDLIEIFEGYSPKAYKDNKGIPTFGYGHKMNAEEQKKYPIGTLVPANVIDSALHADTTGVNNEINRIYPGLDDSGIRLALQNLYYQGGQKLIRGARNADGSVNPNIKGYSPKLEQAVNNFILSPTQQNKDSIVYEMNYSDDIVDDNQNMASRYGINRALVDGTLSPIADSIIAAKNSGKYTLYRSRTGKDNRAKKKK